MWLQNPSVLGLWSHRGRTQVVVPTLVFQFHGEFSFILDFFGFFSSRFHRCPIMGIMVDHQPHGVIICFVRNFTPNLLMFLVLLKSFSFPPRAHFTPFSEFCACQGGSKNPRDFGPRSFGPIQVGLRPCSCMSYFGLAYVGFWGGSVTCRGPQKPMGAHGGPWGPMGAHGGPRAQGPGKAIRPIEPVALHKKGAKVQQ